MTVPMQRCTACGAAQYPVRDLCRACLTDTLELRDEAATGVVLAESRLHHSLDPAFKADLPLRIGAVRLDAGVRVIAMLADAVQAGTRVALRLGPNSLGAPVFIAEEIASHD